MPGHASHSFLPMQTDRARLLALASEEELALMKKTQQLAEEVRQCFMTACWSFYQQAVCTQRSGHCCAEQKASDRRVLLMNAADQQQWSDSGCQASKEGADKLQSRCPQCTSVQMVPQQPHAEA